MPIYNAKLCMSGKWLGLVCVHRYYLKSLAEPRPTVAVVCNADNESILLIATVNNNDSSTMKVLLSHFRIIRLGTVLYSWKVGKVTK